MRRTITMIVTLLTVLAVLIVPASVVYAQNSHIAQMQNPDTGKATEPPRLAPELVLYIGTFEFVGKDTAKFTPVPDHDGLRVAKFLFTPPGGSERDITERVRIEKDAQGWHIFGATFAIKNLRASQKGSSAISSGDR